jgi:hypothetical protein
MKRGGVPRRAPWAPKRHLGPRIACGWLTSSKREAQVGHHRSASASRLLGLDGFQVFSAELVAGEWQLAVQTTATVVGCVGCGERATPHGRRAVRVRDLPAGGRPVVLWWRKRLWRCGEPAGLRGPDLDRAGGRHPSAGGADRAGPGRGLPAGRHRRPRGRGGRPRLGGRLGRPSWGRWLTTAPRWWTTPHGWTVWPRSGWTRPASSRPPAWRPPGG